MLCWGVAHGADFPNRPLKMVVPFPAGGTTDLVARVAAERLGTVLKQPVVVENRPGGNTVLGGTAVVNSPADGYTMLFVGGSSMTTVFNKSVPYELFTALAPVAPLYQGPFYLFASTAVPANNLKELVAYAKAHPGKLDYGSAVSTTMMSMEALKAAAGIEVQHVPYKGSAPVTAALLANEVQLAFDGIASNRAHVAAGKMKIIAVGGRKRTEEFPNVPTVAESGYPGFLTVFNGGAWVPKGTPKEVIDVLNRAFNEVTRTPEYKAVAAKAGTEALNGTPEDFRHQIETELAFWAAAAKVAKYVPE